MEKCVPDQWIFFLKKREGMRLRTSEEVMVDLQRFGEGAERIYNQPTLNKVLKE